MGFIKTPISILHELSQKSKKTPKYELLSSEGLGTTNTSFSYRVDAGEVSGFGKARSKRNAKHEAAKDALAKFMDLGLYIPEESAASLLQTFHVNQEREKPNLKINIINKLQHFVRKHDMPPVEYTEISETGPAHQRLFTLQCTVGDFVKTASKYSKRIAKHTCAQLMYQHLLETLPPTDSKLSDLERPPLGDVLEKYSKTRTNFNKKKRDCKLKCSEFPRAINITMKEKNLSFEDLWQDINAETEENLVKILNKLQLEFTLETVNNEDNFIYFLTIDSEPNFSFAKIADSKKEAIPYIVAEAFEFLKLMTAQ